MEETDEVLKNIYQLSLHETKYGEMQWGLRTHVTRVPGGWIYQQIHRARTGVDNYLNPVFVPYNKEFK